MKQYYFTKFDKISGGEGLNTQNPPKIRLWYFYSLDLLITRVSINTVHAFVSSREIDVQINKTEELHEKSVFTYIRVNLNVSFACHRSQTALIHIFNREPSSGRSSTAVVC